MPPRKKRLTVPNVDLSLETEARLGLQWRTVRFEDADSKLRYLNARLVILNTLAETEPPEDLWALTGSINHVNALITKVRHKDWEARLAA